MIETPFGKQVENGGRRLQNFREIVHSCTVQSRQSKREEDGISGSGTVETVPLCRNANSSTESVEGLQTSTQGTLE
jgi:hypothetical protein